MHPYADGRHEHGQNFLTDQRTIRRITDLVAQTSGPILEIGPGRGALTIPLQRTGRPLTAVEIHPPLVQSMRHKMRAGNEIVQADFLQYRLPQQPSVVVGNLPFHLTTAILRKLFYDRWWSQAILLAQWEAARRRAGVGGASMMTAQWAPYYEFALEGRIPAGAYTPTPSVDAGLFTVTRRSEPLVPWSQRKAFARFVHSVFTGPGRGMAQILRYALGSSKAEAGRLCTAASIRADALPKQLSAQQWSALWQTAPVPSPSRSSGGATGAQGRRAEPGLPRRRRQRT